MSAQVIDGLHIRSKVLKEIEQALADKKASSNNPGLTVIQVGEDAASVIYIRQKRFAAESLGYRYQEMVFPEKTSVSELMQHIGALNQDTRVNGILLQLPLPSHLDTQLLQASISPDKDVDGLHPANAGRLFQGLPALYPCTPLGVMHILTEIGFDPAGKRATIVGRSNIVGKPMAMMLLAAHATATICHRQSELLQTIRDADLVVSAVGVPGCIRGEWIKRGAVVIDVGINRLDGKLVGDVEFTVAAQRASFITPVPGGVGAMTVAMLMRNTYLAWSNQQFIDLQANMTPLA